MRYSLKTIKAGGAKELSIHSFESGIYLVEAAVGSNMGYVTDSKGKTISFHSIRDVKTTFEGVNSPLWLIQETAYDEMCGSTESPSAAMRMPIHM